MRTYECEESAFKAWLQTNTHTAIRQNARGCVLALFFQSEGVEHPAVFTVYVDDERMYKVDGEYGRTDQYFLPDWMTAIVRKFDSKGAGQATADELREEFA